MAHHRIWKFRPPVGREGEFQVAYSSSGKWSQLFSNAAGFLGSKLLRPAGAGGWWLTIDRWETAADFEAFTESFGAQYRALDAELEGVSGEEEFVGAFEG